MKIKRNKILKIIRICTYILIIISLILLKYTDIINTKCYIHENTGILCPTCGITRAIKSILNGNIMSAVENNAYFTMVLLPIFIILLIEDILCIITKKKSFVEIILGEL